MAFCRGFDVISHVLVILFVPGVVDGLVDKGRDDVGQLRGGEDVDVRVSVKKTYSR